MESEFERFLTATESCFVIVGESGSGKTNSICQLAIEYSSQFPVLLVSGSRYLDNDSGLLKVFADELGYSSGSGIRWQHGIEDFFRVLSERDTTGIIFIDGISENDNVVLMKRSVVNILDRYGRAGTLKICLSCRGVLWPRFRAGLPTNHLFKPIKSPMPEMAETDNFPIGFAGDLAQGDQAAFQSASSNLTKQPISEESAHYLHRWTDGEFQKAVSAYQKHFNITFQLTAALAERCKIPLILRLLCEANEGLALGELNHLPVSKVFSDYVEVKVNSIADHFGLSIKPDQIYSLLLKLRVALWEDQDATYLRNHQVLAAVSEIDTARAQELYTKLLDEGILIQLGNGAESSRTVGFLFTELGDYFLLKHFLSTYSKVEDSMDLVINNLCALVRSDSVDNRVSAEKILELLARNLNETALQENLLEQTLQTDLFLFSKCAELKLMRLDLPEDTAQKAREFARCLARWYSRVIRLYFPELHSQFDPHLSLDSVEQALGMTVYTSPENREISYHYDACLPSRDRVIVTVTNDYPTFRLSLVHGEDEFPLHDPDKGMLISIWRDSHGATRRTLNFEVESPFAGVSVCWPEKVAKYDIWQELNNIIANRWLAEPFPMINERAVSLENELQEMGVDIESAQAGERSEIDSWMDISASPRQRQEIATKLDQLRQHLETLGDNYNEDWLPGLTW